MLELYELALKLMREAETKLEAVGRPTLSSALAHRDGLMIAVLVQAPMRRSNIAGLRLGKHLVRTAAEFTLVIAAEQMKNGRETEYPLSGASFRSLSLAISRPFGRRLNAALAMTGSGRQPKACR